MIYRKRHLLAAIIDFRKEAGVTAEIEWENIDEVLSKIEKEAQTVRSVCISLADHLEQQIIPLGRLVAFAMSNAGFAASEFIERGLLWDTGPITNSGRAMTTVFQGLTSSWYEPMSLGEESGYGRHDASEAGKRQVVLRISPVPASRPSNFVKTAGFRADFENTQSGMMSEELTAFIQPIAGTKRLIPLRVDAAHGIRFGKIHHLLPGVN